MLKMFSLGNMLWIEIPRTSVNLLFTPFFKDGLKLSYLGKEKKLLITLYKDVQ